ncbi:MAG: class I SAM-dependent methyltransferase [Bacillota bacterium]
MYLKPRLAALAGLIPAGGVVADIGTDHALLPLYLARYGLAARVIAVENRSGTIAQAKRSLERFGHTGSIELRLGEGLSVIRQDDRVDTVVIAGMSGRTICRIMHDAREKWGWFGCMLLQPIQEAALLRRFLAANGMCLTAEKLAREGSRIYEIMAVRRGRQKINHPLFYELGACLLRDGDPLLGPFIRHKLHRCRHVLAALQQSAKPESRVKEAYYREKESLLKEVLALVGDDKHHS